MARMTLLDLEATIGSSSANSRKETAGRYPQISQMPQVRFA
jgi:hypothetical protein